MFDIFRNNRRIVQIVLAIIILPFALWGLDSYVAGGGRAGEIASVGKTPITLEEFQRALVEQQDRLRQQLGNNQALLESPEFRRSVLEELINQRLLQLHASQARMVISNEMLAEFIGTLPVLQVDGRFSRERYLQLVAGQNMSVEQFEEMLRRDLLAQKVTFPLTHAAVGGKLSSDRWLSALLEERVITEATLSAEQFVAGLSKPDAAAVKLFYDENRARFELPEQVRVEYLVLSQQQLMDGVKISEADIRAAYDAQAARHRVPEQRRASHILIQVAQDAPADDVRAAQDKAAQLLAQLRATPADFARLARQHSQDQGSAANGGDLGFFGRGMMVKPFEDAAFALQENQISDVVRTDFGFHIIRLTAVRAEQARKLEEVRNEILTELKRQAGTRLYAEAAEGFANLVYEQSDSLQPAADKYGLTLLRSDWLVKDGQLPAPFAHAKLAQAVFAEDAVKHKRNTEAIETAPHTLVSARVVEHKPAAILPLDQVAGVIEQALMHEAALANAVAAGQAELEKLKRGEKSALLSWGPPRAVSRLQATNLDREASKVVFGMAGQNLPVYAGIRTASGYTLYRLVEVKTFDPAALGDTAQLVQVLRQQYDEILAREELTGWLAGLRQQHEVKINQTALERR